MRLFLAVDLPQSVKNELDQQLRALKKEYAFFNWVPPENYHITLHFFGERNDVDKIKQKIEEAVFDINSFNLYAWNASLFMQNNILLYISFRREKKMEEIAERINKSFQGGDEKKFIAHLTIARARIPSKQQYLNLKKKLLQLPIEIEFAVNKIHLFQSIIEGKRPSYKKISGFSLMKQHQS